MAPKVAMMRLDVGNAVLREVVSRALCTDSTDSPLRVVPDAGTATTLDLFIRPGAPAPFFPQPRLNRAERRAAARQRAR